MTALEQLNRYLRDLEQRLRLFTAARGLAITVALALVLTIVLAVICNRFQFAQGIVLPLRLLLYAAVAVAVSFGLALPLMKLTRKRATQMAEQSIPGFGERLLTASERVDTNNPFSELIAEDALRVAGEHSLDQVRSKRWMLGFAGMGALAAAILIWLVSAGPGYLGYGASLLWTGTANVKQRPLYEVVVSPGNKTIRRKSDQAIEAELIGFSARRVTVHARYGKSDVWQEAGMEVAQRGDKYRFLFPAIADNVEYFVQADGARSKQFKISVKDLPVVKRVRVLTHFPSALGLKDVNEDPGGDIRAVEGSHAEISVLTDRPLDNGLLQLDNGQKINLTKQEGNWSKGELAVAKDGSYHIAALDDRQAIRISDDFYIEAKKDEPPSVKIVRPGHDPRVSPIEEMPVEVEAEDDFGVKALELHYAVNGGSEQVARFKSSGSKDERGHSTIYLENFKLAPGDIVSMYATARDAGKTVKSDIQFAQAEAFDYKFSQSQQSGGGMGGGGQQDKNISERQKQIIAATFNELRGESHSKSTIQEQARFLSDLEGKLSTQAQTLAQRMSNRELSSANAEFESFAKLMTSASLLMNEAVGHLGPAKWQEALVPEQKALQSLLRAEAIFRDIQVAFGQQGGGGQSGGADRELARMFDLELDTAKNQYETGQKQEDSANQQQKAIDDAFERLQMLARRQQELAQQRNEQQTAEQRWQEEQLRREAEELRKQIEQLAKNTQGSQQGQSSGSSQGQNSQSGRAGSQGASGSQSQQSREMNSAMQHAGDSLRQAEDNMRKAVSSGDAAAQQRAAGQLAEAQRELASALHRDAGNSLSDLAQKADSLAKAQRDVASRLKQMYGGRTGQGGDEMSNILGGGGEGAEMPEMDDPDNMRFGYGYRRRNWQQALRPPHHSTDEEKSIASEKERISRELEQLQRGLEQQGQALQSTAPGASNQIRRALSEAEQKELALRMQKNAQWIREGYGGRNLGMEDRVTAGMEQLSRDLHGAQKALSADQAGAGKGAGDKTAQALAQVRQLREKLERAQAAAGQSSGQRAGANGSSNSQSGSNAGSAEGNQSAQNGRGGSGPALRRGNGEGDLSRRDLEQAIGQISALRGQIGGQDRALGGYFGGTLGHLRDLNADPNVLQATIGQDAIASLERLEAELSRRLGEQQTQGARSGSPENPSEKDRDAVAEYFKKLSQTHTKP
jgi:hypothetical protein